MICKRIDEIMSGIMRMESDLFKSRYKLYNEWFYDVHRRKE